MPTDPEPVPDPAPDPRPRCAPESILRHEPMIATASRVRRWLLVEQPGPWGSDALSESRLDPGVAATLRTNAEANGVRVVLVRLPGWVTADRRRAFLVRSGRDGRWIEEVDVTDTADLENLDLSVLDSEQPPGIGTARPDGMFLVCTNGKHDPCCADFGRPVLRALQEGGAPDIWESSHIGGDRFAANIVCLPTGVYYGRVTPEEAVRLVSEHCEGLVDLDFYRGRSCYPPLVQAAEVFIRRSLHERRIDALHLESAVGEGRDRALVTFVHDDGGRLEAYVAREAGQAELLTCSAEKGSRPWNYQLLELLRHQG